MKASEVLLVHHSRSFAVVEEGTKILWVYEDLWD
jgi:hypothetical protein